MVFPSYVFSRIAIPITIATFFLSDIPRQLQFYDEILRNSDYILSMAQKEGEGIEEFDFVIVGAGSAGAVLAKRLSESGNLSVCLIEAGGDPSPVSENFYIQPHLLNSVMDWTYQTVPQDNCCFWSPTKQCIIPRGRALGGSTAINGLLYNRCSPKDYDSWANFTNDQSWSWENVLPFYKKLEHYEGFYPGPTHGTGGEYYVGKILYAPTEQYIFEAAREKGLRIGDLNEEQFVGFGRIDYNLKNGLRWGTYQAFLEPILNRTNLKIYRYATAQKIHLDSQNRAHALTYKRHGYTRVVSARNEIIISAGVIESPKLLMLSGIGHTEHLEQVGITPLLDLPVGDYLQDHPGFDPGPFFINQTFGSSPDITNENINEFIQNQTGPLSEKLYSGNESAPQFAMGYMSSSFHNDDSRPDIQFYIHEMPVASPSPDAMDKVFFGVSLMRPDSVGTIRLASSNPDDYPLIDPKLYDVPTDIERMIDGVEFMFDIFENTTAYKSLGTRYGGMPIPECESYEFKSRDYWTCFAKQWTYPYGHPTSSCRMGPNSTVAILDSKLRVFNTTGLRVIDSSIMPFSPNGNTNMPSILIGEIGSYFILQDWEPVSSS